ncbi:uncharacterized protein G2W53_027598 [Senna tora]|uniref:Uncharacterized protein n=1 Tax=Senna tora TaxID=362788 RepID=A0A834THE6_9FABA|nr:uncharacterized protein G2W53_027598 [Senna tora]
MMLFHPLFINYKGRDIKIPATRAPFDEDETHFVEALFFDEHAGKKGFVGDIEASSSGTKKIMGGAGGPSWTMDAPSIDAYDARRTSAVEVHRRCRGVSSQLQLRFIAAILSR